VAAAEKPLFPAALNPLLGEQLNLQSWTRKEIIGFPPQFAVPTPKIPDDRLTVLNVIPNIVTNFPPEHSFVNARPPLILAVTVVTSIPAPDMVRDFVLVTVVVQVNDPDGSVTVSPSAAKLILA
jgi:hypothetical protein